MQQYSGFAKKIFCIAFFLNKKYLNIFAFLKNVYLIKKYLLPEKKPYHFTTSWDKGGGGAFRPPTLPLSFGKRPSLLRV